MGEVAAMPGPQTRGRRGNDGQEQVPEPSVVESSMTRLLQLYAEAEGAKEVLSDAVKKCAEKSGFNAGAIKKFVKARADDDDDNFSLRKREAQQLVLLFEQVGEG